jgi:transposase
MSRHSFDKQIKLSAVKLIVEEGFSVKEVSKELDIHANSLYRWFKEYEKYVDSAFPGKGSAIFDVQYEIKKLEKENRYLKEELELLKKFRVFLNSSKKSDCKYHINIYNLMS